MINIAIYLENMTKENSKAKDEVQKIINSILHQLSELRKKGNVQLTIFCDEPLSIGTWFANVSIMPIYYSYYYSGSVICFSESSVNKLVKNVKISQIIIMPTFNCVDFVAVASRKQLPEESYICTDENIAKYYNRIRGLNLSVKNKDNFLLEKYNAAL